MSVDPATAQGQSVTTGPYEVSRAKVAEFARAIGETSPLCHDLEAAQVAGYPDVIAPPTFAFVPASEALAALTAHLDAPLRNQVHGEQSFTAHRPITAGDALTTTATLEKVRVGGGRMIVTIACEIVDGQRQPVTSARSVILISGVQS